MQTNNPQTNSKRRSLRARLFGIIMFFAANGIVIWLTARREFGGGKAADALPLKEAWQQVPGNRYWLLAALAAVLLAIALDTIKYRCILHTAVNDGRISLALETFIVGKYYDYITPMGAGGQPFQAFSLHRHGFDWGKCTSVPIMAFILNQAAFSLLALASLLAGFTMEGITPWIRICAWIGILCYLALPVFLVIMTLVPRTAGKILHGLLRLWHRLRPASDPDEIHRRLESSLQSYMTALREMWRDRRLLGIEVICSLGYNLLIAMLPYCVLRSFGVCLPFWATAATCFIIYSAIAFIPTPGNAGAAEGMFYIIFSAIAVQGSIFWCMLVWRLFCYYIFLLLGLLLMLKQAVTGLYRNKADCTEEGNGAEP